MIVEGDNKENKEEDPPPTNGVYDTKEKKDDHSYIDDDIKSVSVENKEESQDRNSEAFTEAQTKLADVTRLAEEKNKILSKEKEDAKLIIGILSKKMEEFEERNRILSKEKETSEEKNKILSKEKEDAIKSLEIEVFKLKEELQNKS